MKVLLALFFAAFFVNLMKKSLTTRFGKSNKKLFAKFFYACNCEFSIFFGYMRNVPFGY